MERIERLKEDNAWSFRQMKRFKGPVLAKAHWDYVLDEMVRRLSLLSSQHLSPMSFRVARDGSRRISKRKEGGN
jgi:hypothetical protein